MPKLLLASYLIYSMLACKPAHMFPSSIIQSCTLSHWFPLKEGFHQRSCELGELVVCPRVLQMQEETAQLFCMPRCCFMEECSVRHLRGSNSVVTVPCCGFVNNRRISIFRLKSEDDLSYCFKWNVTIWTLTRCSRQAQKNPLLP